MGKETLVSLVMLGGMLMERYCEEHEWQKQEDEWSDGYECIHCETIGVMDENSGSIVPILTMPLPNDPDG